MQAQQGAVDIKLGGRSPPIQAVGRVLALTDLFPSLSRKCGYGKQLFSILFLPTAKLKLFACAAAISVLSNRSIYKKTSDSHNYIIYI